MALFDRKTWIEYPSRETLANAAGWNDQEGRIEAAFNALQEDAVKADVIVDGTTDNTTRLNSQMAELGGANEPTMLQLPATRGGPPIRILGEVVRPNGVSLVGAGNDVTSPGTRILADAAGARILDNASGGLIGMFTVDGNDVATTPYVFSGSGVEPARTVYAHGTVLNLDVQNAAQDNISILENQNMLWLGIFAQGAGRDNLVWDWETGGHSFDRLELNDPGRHNLRVDQTRTAPRGYAQPTHLTVRHGIFERPAGANANVNVVKGELLVLRDTIIQQAVAAPHIDLSNGTGPSDLLLDSCFLSGHASQPSGIHLSGSGNKVVVAGYLSVVATPYVFDAPSGGSILLYGELRMGVGVARATPATPLDSAIRSEYRGPHRITLPQSAAYFLDLLLEGDAGGRIRLLPGGASGAGGAGIAFMDGSNFTQRSLTVRGDGLLATNSGVVFGGQTRHPTLVETVVAQTLASNGTVTITSANGGVQRVTLQANATAVNISNGSVEGQMLEVQFIQDATGTRTVAWPTSNVRWVGAAVPVTTTTANRRDIVRLRWNHADTKWDEVSRSMAVG